jgi:hypothetical protein
MNTCLVCNAEGNLVMGGIVTRTPEGTPVYICYKCYNDSATQSRLAQILTDCDLQAQMAEIDIK